MEITVGLMSIRNNMLITIWHIFFVTRNNITVLKKEKNKHDVKKDNCIKTFK